MPSVRTCKPWKPWWERKPWPRMICFTWNFCRSLRRTSLLRVRWAPSNRMSQNSCNSVFVFNFWLPSLCLLNICRESLIIFQKAQQQFCCFLFLFFPKHWLFSMLRTLICCIWSLPVSQLPHLLCSKHVFLYGITPKVPVARMRLSPADHPPCQHHSGLCTLCVSCSRFSRLLGSILGGLGFVFFWESEACIHDKMINIYHLRSNSLTPPV